MFHYVPRHWRLLFAIFKWRYLFFFVHSIFLLLVSLMLQESYFLYKDEEAIIQLGTIIKRSFTDYKKPDPNRFLFINTSYDNTLIDVFDETGIVPLGNRPITDRESLTKLFNTIGQNPNYQFVMCDIFFELPTPHDKSLAGSINNLHNFYASSLMSTEDSLMKPVVNVPTSLTVVEVFGDIFTKFKLNHGTSYPSMPLEHYLNQTGSHYVYKPLFPSLNGYNILDPFFLNLRITNYDLLVQQSYPLINLGELLLLGDEAIAELTKDRIIVIGDFLHNDNVETYIGNISGPLILTNAYLALENEDMIIKPGFLMFLLISFYLVNLIVFSPSDYLDRLIKRFGVKTMFQNLFKGFTVLAIFYIMSVMSFILFNIHINILMISLYLGLADYAVRNWSRGKPKLEAGSQKLEV